jgi:hypothetical protein
VVVLNCVLNAADALLAFARKDGETVLFAAGRTVKVYSLRCGIKAAG